MEFGKNYVVFSVRKHEKTGTVVWVRAGHAVANKDGSTNVTLDMLPLDGKLHIRESAEARVMAGPQEQKPQQPVQLVDAQSMGGH